MKEPTDLESLHAERAAALAQGLLSSGQVISWTKEVKFDETAKCCWRCVNSFLRVEVYLRPRSG